MSDVHTHLGFAIEGAGASTADRREGPPARCVHDASKVGRGHSWPKQGPEASHAAAHATKHAERTWK
jgi:hypothetical protein